MKARTSPLARAALLSLALSVATGLVHLASAQGPAKVCGPTGAAIDSAVEQLVRVPLKQAVENRSSSASVVMYVRNGQVRIAQAAGVEDPVQRVPLTTAQSRFSLNSISKTFTAISLAQLKLAGRIHSYDDPANTYLRRYHLPDFGARPITLRELATHTSGLDKVDAGMSVLKLLPEDAAAAQYRGLKPLFFRPPGSIKAYSGFGIDVLGILVSDVSGAPYGEYVQSEILEPLSMSSTIPAYPSGGSVPHEVKAFDPVEMRMLKPTKYAAPFDYPANGTFTTGDDMVRYLMALLGSGGASGPITPAVRHELFNVLYQVTPQGSAHALIFEILRARGHTMVYHMGVGSHICMLGIVPDEDAGLFFCVANGRHMLDPQQLARAGFDAMTRGCDAPTLPSSDAVETPVWHEDWGRYLGDYVSTNRQHLGAARLRDVMHPGEVPILHVERGQQGLRVNGADGQRELSPGVFGTPGGFEFFSFYRDAGTGNMVLNSSIEATAVFERVSPHENPDFEHKFVPALVLLTASGLLWPLWSRARRYPWATAGALLLGLATLGQALTLGTHPWDQYLLGILWPLLLMRIFAFMSIPAAALLSVGVVKTCRDRPIPPIESRRPGLGALAWTHLLLLTLAAWLTVAALMHLGMIGPFLR